MTKVLVATLFFTASATAQPSQIAPDTSPAVARSLVTSSFVPPLVTPDYDKDYLDPLHAAQAALAVQEAAKVAEDAQLAREAAQAAYVAPAATVTQPAQAGPLGNLYDYGACTWFVASRVAVPATMGNATNWESGLLGAGWHYGLAAGSIGVSHAGLYGHVVLAESVVAGVVTISEMNAGAGWGRVDTRIALASEFIWLHQ